MGDLIDTSLIFGVKLIKFDLDLLPVRKPEDYGMQPLPCQCAYCGTRASQRIGNCDNCGAPR